MEHVDRLIPHTLGWGQLGPSEKIHCFTKLSGWGGAGYSIFGVHLQKEYILILETRDPGSTLFGGWSHLIQIMEKA